MDWAERQYEQETLKSIAATLIRLAVLAEFLCVLPLWLRIPMLALLRPAEAVARAFAIAQAGGALALPPAAAGGVDADGRAEALRLARCLRALAVVFGALKASLGRRLFRAEPNRSVAHHAAATPRRDHMMGAWRAMVPDAGRIDTS